MSFTYQKNHLSGARDKLNFRQDKHIFSPNVRQASKKSVHVYFFLNTGCLNKPTVFMEVMGDPKSDRWRYLVFQFYYPYIRAVSFSQTALIMILHRQ